MVAILFQCQPKATPPNIVFFFVDDMGWQDTSVPFHSEETGLNRQYHTPNMETLAKDGMKFTQAYAYAVCSPSRISLMTGLNAARHGVTNWTLRKDRSPDPDHAWYLPPDWNMNGLTNEPGRTRTIYAKTLPQLLKQGGYRTIHVGKAHFGAMETPGEDPMNLGFDVNIAGHAAGGPGSYLGVNNFSGAWRNADLIWDVPGLEKYHGQDIFMTEALTLEALHAVEQAVKESKPFYLYMSHYAIHAPWEIDNRYYQKYMDAGLSQFDATYAAMIEGMDKSLGDIREKLKELSVAENTVIVFMSDNGAPKQAARNFPLRGHKLTPYEGGVRVPMIVSWPGVTKPQTIQDQYVMVEDVFPTFLEIAGIQYEHKVDGVSFVNLVKSDSIKTHDRSIYWHFPHTYDQPPYSSIRKSDWKLIYHHLDQRLELFNITIDIGEQNDLGETEISKLRELAGELTDFLISSKAMMPSDKTTGELLPYPDEALTMINSTK